MGAAVPFRVQWELFSPVVVPSMPIHLDALLSWARVQEAEHAGVVDSWATQHDLPLEQHATEHGWCFKASALAFEFAGEAQQLHYIRRSDIDELVAEPYMAGLFKLRSEKVLPAFDPQRGAYKASSVTVTQRFASQVTAYGVGDIDRVQQLLRRVDSLGKLRRRGKGSVRSFQVEECDAASQLWASRNLPVGSEFAVNHALTQQRLHSPYWAKERQMVLAPVDFSG